MIWARRPCEIVETGSNTRMSALCGFCGTINYVVLDVDGMRQDLCNHNIAQNLKKGFFEFTNDRRSRNRNRV